MPDREWNKFPTLRQVRDIIISGLAIIIGWKILDANFALDFGVLSLTDVLALLLGFFAIALSALFFFKTTETSNKFYDNSYRFTKEISEILGRIEAGFGERLRHLDEGYSGLQQRLDRIPIPFDFESAEAEIEKEEKEVEKLQSERKELLARLAERAELHENEKKDFFERLEEKEQELDSARQEVSVLRRQLSRAELEATPENVSARQVASARYLLRREVIPLLLPYVSGTNKHRISLSNIHWAFRQIQHQLPVILLHNLQGVGYLDSDREINPYGLRAIRELIQELITADDNQNDKNDSVLRPAKAQA